MNTQYRLIQTVVYLFIGLFVYSFTPAHAGAAGCEPVFGGGPTCTENSLTIQKTVLNPTTNRFVHSLGSTDSNYHANDIVTFQIMLTNNGSNSLDNIVVKDTFPGVLTFAGGPGQFDKNKNLLTFQAHNLASHHSQLFTVRGRVVSQEKWGQDSLCESNNVSALPSSGQVRQDSSQFCVQSLTSTPATGPEALGLLALIPTALAGFGIKKLARK